MLVAGLVDLEHLHALGKLGVPLRERVEAGAQEDVLADALARYQVFDEPGASNDRGAVAAGTARMHVRPVLPPALGRGEGETDLVLDQVWW